MKFLLTLPVIIFFALLTLPVIIFVGLLTPAVAIGFNLIATMGLAVMAIKNMI